MVIVPLGLTMIKPSGHPGIFCTSVQKVPAAGGGNWTFAQTGLAEATCCCPIPPIIPSVAIIAIVAMPATMVGNLAFTYIFS